jgi:hypothetical protein
MARRGRIRYGRVLYDPRVAVRLPRPDYPTRFRHPRHPRCSFLTTMSLLSCSTPLVLTVLAAHRTSPNKPLLNLPMGHGCYPAQSGPPQFKDFPLARARASRKRLMYCATRASASAWLAKLPKRSGFCGYSSDCATRTSAPSLLGREVRRGECSIAVTHLSRGLFLPATVHSASCALPAVFPFCSCFRLSLSQLELPAYPKPSFTETRVHAHGILSGMERESTITVKVRLVP